MIGIEKQKSKKIFAKTLFSGTPGTAPVLAWTVYIEGNIVDTVPVPVPVPAHNIQ